MTKIPDFCFYGLLLVLFSTNKVCCRYMPVNKHSLYPGGTVSFELVLEEEDLGFEGEPVHIRWFKENITRDLSRLNEEYGICIPKDDVIFLPEMDNKFLVDSENQNRTLHIKNVSLGDTGIYCSAVWQHGTNFSSAEVLPAYLKVTLDNHGRDLPMYTIFLVVGLWSLALIVYMSLRFFYLEHGPSRKKRNHLVVVLTAQNELLV